MQPLSPTAAIAKTSKALQAAQHTDAAADARLFVEHVLELPLEKLLLQTQPLTAAQQNALQELVAAHLQGTPVAYLLGYAYFYGRKFFVTPNVLIPRRDTEVVVEAALRKIVHGDRVLDLCCGSGCIGITLALECPSAEVTACDISEQAVRCTQKNARAHAAAVNCAMGDLFAAVPNQRFDIIVCNPPYIAIGDVAVASDVQRFEPQLALYAGEDGLAVYRRILPAARQALLPGGCLVLEHGATQQAVLCQMLQQNGYHILECIADLEQRPRGIVAILEEGWNA